MPVYNAERYLTEAMDSILAQTFTDFELIVIDDGSTDGSRAILNRYAATDPRVRMIRRPNTGLTPALNECLELARGEFIARMDADDVSLPERFELQIDYLRANPDVLLLGGAYDLIDGAGRLLRRVSQPPDDRSLQEICLSGRTPICHPSAMMRTAETLRVGGYDEQFEVAQDLDLWLRLGEIGKMACLPQTLVKYRMHENSMSEQRQEQQVAEMRLSCELAWRRRGIGGQFLGLAGWRATDRQSRHDFWIKYGWWAFNSGQRRTALLYGSKAVTAAPLSSHAWRLLLCAALKAHPGPKLS